MAYPKPNVQESLTTTRSWHAFAIGFFGAVLAIKRLDIVNCPAYVGLGLALCRLYDYTGSLLAPMTTPVLNNAAMLVLLFSGHQ